VKLWICPSCEAEMYGPDQQDTECPECGEAKIRALAFTEVESK
jgi:predicted RNA-binding Zn-ribbon protein involved in translation (DUF1610 family)